MKDLKSLLDQVNQEEEQLYTPMNSQPATAVQLPQNYNDLAQAEAIEQAAPVAAPIVPTENIVKTKQSISSTIPQSIPSNGSESAESRLERLMRELNDQRNTEREDAASRQMKANIIKGITDNVGLLVGGAQAMNSKASVTPSQVKSIDVGDLVGQVDKKFSGDREALLDQYKQLLNARDRSEQRKFQQETLNLQREGLGIKRDLANQKANKLSNTLSPGEKKSDEAFAKDFNNLTSKGFNNAQTAISRLDKLAEELDKEGTGLLVAGGGRTSILPDALRSSDSIRIRDSAQNEANATLKELFPGSLSDDERRAAAKEFYNDKLNNAENAKIIRSKSEQLKRSLEDQRRKAQYFAEQGTLKGMGLDEKSTAAPSTDIDTKVDSFMKKNNITDRNEAIKILKEAGKL